MHVTNWYFDNTIRKMWPPNTSQPMVLHMESSNLPLFELLILSCILY